MPNHLEIVAAKIRLELSQALPGTSSNRILSLLNDLANAIQMTQEDAPENTGLRTQVDNLSAAVGRLNETINWQASILEATKRALAMPDDRTMTQMPEYAAQILNQAQQRP